MARAGRSTPSSWPTRWACTTTIRWAGSAICKFQLFRAGRCVVDTGIHHLGWSREQAIAYFVDLDGDAPGFATREVERYCATPGQACSYKLGHTTWIRARARAEAALGARYDIKDFHEAGLSCGRVPLEVLDTVVDAWVVERKAMT